MAINPEHLATEIAKFRDQRRALQEMVIQCFSIGSKVLVKPTKDVGSIWSVVHGFPEMLHVRFADNSRQAIIATDLERYDEPY